MDADSDTNVDNEDGSSSLLECINPISRLVGTSCKIVDYFEEADKLQQGLKPNARTPFCTFANAQVAFHLNYDPGFKCSMVDKVSLAFQIPDLRAALSEYVTQARSEVTHFTLGGQRVNNQKDSDFSLPSSLEVWTSFRLQSKMYYTHQEILPAQTVNASPPSGTWPLGHFDPVIFNTDPEYQWPHSGILGVL